MENKEFETRLNKAIHTLSPRLSAYHTKAGLVDTALGKIERTKRPLIKQLSLLRAASHTTDLDHSAEAEAYRQFILEKAVKIYEEIRRLDKQEESYKALVNAVNSKFVNDIIEKTI